MSKNIMGVSSQIRESSSIGFDQKQDNLLNKAHSTASNYNLENSLSKSKASHFMAKIQQEYGRTDESR